jgi:anaerobic selenocysteine-containing dehydrogenase
MAFDNPPAGFGTTACPHDCPSTCALEVELLGPDRIGAVRGAEANRYTAGVICNKVSRYAERAHHKDRLTRPLLRTGPKNSRQFREIGWDEALDRLAGRLADDAQRLGAEAVWPYFYAGTMGLVQRDGINRLRNTMGYSRQKKTFCTTLARAGWNAGVGALVGPDPLEMAEADLIVCWGGNPVSTQVNVMTHVARARKTRGARFLVVDPYRTPTAQVADQHLMLRPGTDAALACAVMHVAFRDGFADRAYMASHADDPAGLEAHLASRDPAWAASITGLTVAEIEGFAREYCVTQRAFIRIGYGFTRMRNGAAQMHAVTCLPTVTGKWPTRGAGALYSLGDSYAVDKTLIEGLDRLNPAVRELDMSRIGAVLTGDRHDLGEGPPVTAMLVQNTNPAAVAPNLNLVHRGLAREDLFLCVHEQFMTDTAAWADLVLPATMFTEHDDFYIAGGHGHLQLGPKLVDPPGECRSNHELLADLARRLGADHPGFAMSARQLADETLRRSGYGGWDAVAATRWVDCQPDFATSHFERGFPNPIGRFRFKPDWAAIGKEWRRMPTFPDHLPVTEAADDTHPFRLVTAPARSFLNSTFTQQDTLIRRESRPTLLVHPDDAADLDLADGQQVTVGNRRGRVTVHARRFAGLTRGTVVIESIWPNAAFPEGVGVNALVSDEPGYPDGGAVYHDSAVWLRPLVAAPAETRIAALTPA